MMRAVRPDKVCIAVLEKTLQLWRDAPERIPLYQLLTASVPTLRTRASTIQSALDDTRVHIEDTEAKIGGGTTPDQTIPGVAVVVDGPGAQKMLDAMRTSETTPVVARIHEGRLWCDLRSVFPEQDQVLTRALEAILSAHRRAD